MAIWLTRSCGAKGEGGANRSPPFALRFSLFILFYCLLGAACQEIPSPPLTWTPEPLIPTATPREAAFSPSSTPPSPTPSATAAFVTLPGPTSTPEPAATSQLSSVMRMGVSGDIHDLPGALAAGLQIGHFLNWKINADWSLPDITFWQMVRLSEAGVVPAWEDLAAAAANQPGSVWIVGNEPDVIWQDNVTPERYAELYHEVYTFVKRRDPKAQIAAAAVTQPTPLRLVYLDQVLAAYEVQFGTAMPVDIWTVHAFILREEADSWGVDIPPGIEAQQGSLYEIADHDDIAIFEANIRAFRQWMWQRGYGERPLAVTEFGILMPFDYGFPPDAVAEFMRQTFDFFFTARDEKIGYADDDNRLVQWWFWYSLHDPDLYPTGNLYERQTAELTSLGQAWQAYINTIMSTD